MARFNKISTITAMRDTGVVPVFYSADVELAKNVLKACYDGGIRAFEFTNRGDFAQDVFAQLVKYAIKECPEMVIGVGTILDPATAAMYLQIGANFVVGPMYNEAVAKVCNRRMVPYIPGCGSVTEVGNAQEAGCDVCKVFPAGSVGGPGFVKGVLAPMPWSMLMVTGDVSPTEENLSGWFKAGVTAVGMGSNLFPKSVIDAKDWKAISKLCKECLDIVKKYK